MSETIFIFNRKQAEAPKAEPAAAEVAATAAAVAAKATPVPTEGICQNLFSI